jgi:hypothetical protein
VNTQQQRLPASTQQSDSCKSDLLPAKAAADARNLDQMSSSYAMALANAQGHMEKAFLLATGIDRIREALTEQVMGHFMKLMNSPLGFTTDRPNGKNPQPYDINTVKDCLIASLLSGFYPINNEWSIISGKFYGGKNGYIRKVAEITNLTDLDVVPGSPVIHEGITVVRVGATWKINGLADGLFDASGKPGRVFPVSQNAGSTADNTIGKALRKAYKAIWDKINGSARSLPDMDDESTTAPSSQPVPEAGKQSLRELPQAKIESTNLGATVAETPNGATGPQNGKDPDLIGAEFEERIQEAKTVDALKQITDDLVSQRAELGERLFTRIGEDLDMRHMQLARETAPVAPAAEQRTPAKRRNF